ncbi:transglycosylase family protein [Nosocomiicoccus ampullae]|nr:transglycosylase family protein [Nosocomiicoccus ampullae]
MNLKKLRRNFTVKKTMMTTGLALGIGLTAFSGVNANASEIEVDEAKLAELAINNPESLNEAPIQEGNYDITFDLEGYTFNFESNGFEWKWSYAPVGEATEAVNNVQNNDVQVNETANYDNVEYSAPVQENYQPSAPAQPKASAPASNNGLNWSGLAACESGGNASAVDPSGTYHGLYQFDAQTWQSVGGSGVASQASAAEQTKRAQMLYEQRGSSPWPVCGANL